MAGKKQIKSIQGEIEWRRVKAVKDRGGVEPHRTAGPKRNEVELTLLDSSEERSQTE